MIQSFGVVIAAIIIYVEPKYRIADPITTFLFAILVVFTTIPVFKECISVLMESVPHSVNAAECMTEMSELPLVEKVSDFHVWTISGSYT